MKKEKIKKIVENVSIIDTSSEGMAVGKIDDLVVFVKGAVPGDVVDVRIQHYKKSFAEGVAEQIKSPSPDRINAVCTHFGTCGGCKWQNLSYTAQLKYKQKTVSDALQRIAGINDVTINEILAAEEPYYYRNKLDFAFSSKKWLTKDMIDSGEFFDNRNGLGFHLPGLFDKVIDIEHCHLQPSPSNEIRLAIKKFALDHFLPFFDIREKTGFLRTLMIRTSSTGQVMVLIGFAEERKETIKKLLDHLQNSFPSITSLMYVNNKKGNDTFHDLEVVLHSGNNYLEEKMENITYRIGPKSFYQTNSKQAYSLYKAAREMAGLNGDEIVYDLYTGTGTIANFVAGKAKKVIGVDYVKEAIDDAKINSAINNITNTIFYAGDMKDVFTEEFVTQNGAADVIITDPPRAGMHMDVVNVLLGSNAKKIIYVSCNPATQARDLILLKEKYSVVSCQPVDMFPQTHHVENIVLLQRKD